MKVYIITFEETYSDGSFYTGVSYVFDTLEKAEKRLEEIKQDEIQYQKDNGRDDAEELVHNLTTENGFIIDFIDEYTKYVIIESEVE